MARRHSPGLVAALLLSLSGCSVAVDSHSEADEETAKDLGELYYHPNLVWSDKSISVCWLNDADPTERGWVRDAVEAAYEPFSDIDFTGWTICGPEGAQIVISTSDNHWPTATGGQKPANKNPNIWLNHFTGSRRDLNDDEHDDFVNCWTGDPLQNDPITGATGRRWTSIHRYCVETLAVHEFFHVLAVDHEQQRMDTPSWCVASPPAGTQVAYGYWDVTSVSNYCNPLWNNDGSLSQLDLSGLGMLYGLDSNDQTWFSSGNVRDYAGSNQDRLFFRVQRENVNNTYNLVVADFDGDDEDDILFYRPTGGTDPLWFGQTDGEWDKEEVDASSGFIPVAGDFNGDGRGDIFWYAPGAKADKIWFGKSNGTFDSATPTNVQTTYTSVVSGDFNGDERSDLLFYSSSGTDHIWWGRADRTFDTSSLTINSGFKPFTGNFDGDQFDDIFLYNPSGNDFIWFGNSNKLFASVAFTVSGDYTPAAGDFDGNGVTDVLWSGDDDETDPVWLFKTPRGSRTVTETSSILGSDSSGADSVPYAGDFNGDGMSDVFWYKAN